MKLFLNMVCCLPLIVLLQCGYTWPTRFERVDADRVKVLDFVYGNSRNQSLFEFIPGDSVMLSAYFSGEKITDIQWKVSYNVYNSITGGDTEYDIEDLAYELFPADSSTFTKKTQVHRLKFKIPENIMYTSKSIKEEYLNKTGFSKEVLLSYIDTMVHTDSAKWNTIPGLSDFLPILQSNAPMFSQVLTVPVRIFATVNGGLKIKSTFTVRYNRFFKYLAGYKDVPVNNNPRINFIGIYKIKEKQNPKFNTQKMTQRDTAFCLFVSDTLDSLALLRDVGRNVVFSDTINIDTGYTYIVMVDSGVFNSVDQRDSGVILGQQSLFSKSPETFYSQWFYGHEFSQVAQVSKDDLMIISSSPNFESALDPPKDTTITHAVLWVQLYDNFTGERLRSSASSLRESKIYFSYTQAYIEELKTR